MREGRGRGKEGERRERKNEENKLRGPENGLPSPKIAKTVFFFCFSSFLSAFLLSTDHVLIDQHVHLISSLVEAEFVHETGSRSAENRRKLQKKGKTAKITKNKAKSRKIRADPRRAH